jgi:hypothetical protein
MYSSWLSSLFYFGYLICEYPTTLLSQKFPIGRFIGLAIVVSGSDTAATCVGSPSRSGVAF